MQNEKSPRTGFRTRMMVYLGVLTALEIVLSRFLSISMWNMKIGFSFIPVVATAILFGPLPAGLMAGLADFLGAILFPIGAYFPGFTLTAALMGIVFGLFLYRRQNIIRIIGAVALNQMVFSLLLNTLWISILYGSPFKALLATRVVQTAILIPVQILLTWLLTPVFRRLKETVRS